MKPEKPSKPLKPLRRNPGLFKGKNFMTPNVRGYYRLALEGGYAELSEGTGLYHEPLYGVTIRPEGPGWPKGDCFGSLRKALEFIEELS